MDEFLNPLSVQRSVTGRAWRWRAGEDRIAFALAQRLELPEMVGRVMAARGLGLDEAADFLTPTLRALLPDPSVLTDMDIAADRLARAAQAGETVGVFGDYDVDGACGTAILTLFLRGLGCTVRTHVPDRMKEGYGPNLPALLALIDAGASLIVCVDCGTAAGDVLRAVGDRAEILVLDHHKAEGAPPPVLATVNPSRLDDRSGLGQICAASVAFLTAVATLRVLRRRGCFAGRPEPDLMGLLDLVALATVCDVMPLTGLNRALVAQGLKVMGRRARPGLVALLEVARAKDAPTAMTCGFALGPRINAGGRISEADLGLRLLLTEDPVEARALAERLDAANRQRQHVEAGVLDAAMRAGEAQLAGGHAVLMLSAAGWHPGVVGIVAGRLREAFNRPSCVGGVIEGSIKGSGRSVPGIDLGAAILAARQAGILATGGGHAMAAGFSLAEARQAEFHDFLDERLEAARAAPAAPHLDIEASLSVPGATIDLANHLARLAPFGSGNDEPILVLPHVRVARSERIGEDGGTVRAYLQGEGAGTRLKCLLFRAKEGPLAEAVTDHSGPMLHVAGHLRAETWNGRTTASFFIRDAAAA